MTYSIFCNNRTAVIEPNSQFTFILIIKNDRGEPVSGLKFKYILKSFKAIRLKEQHGISDDKGSIFINIHSGDVLEEVILKAESTAINWEGKLYVTKISIDCPFDMSLSDVEETLLKMLFWDNKKLKILREFGGGLSGSRVLQVQAVPDQGSYLTQIVKIGPRDEMKNEQMKYKSCYKDRLYNAAPVPRYADHDIYAAIIYGDANAASSLEPVIPFADYFVKSEIFNVKSALFSIIDKGLRQIYHYYTVKNMTFRSLLGKFLPENMVVSLVGNKKPYGVYYPNADIPDIKKLNAITPKDVERFHFKHSPGDKIYLNNFTISKMQDGDLNLEDIEKVRYKIKVRYDGVSDVPFSTGDTVDVIAKFLTDRDKRIEFAVQDCLERHGLKRCSKGYQLNNSVYPEPLELLKKVLEKNVNIAWGTIHGDLHWDNIMLEGPSNWWLIDFGLTGDGPVLFDFVKLELYLRIKVLSGISKISPEIFLSFEQALMDNPFGYLPNKSFDIAVIDKAMESIQTIRRLSKKYIIDDFFDYWRLLFVYAMALGKYYPIKDKWDNVEKERKGLDSLNQSGHKFFMALGPALAVGKVIKWKMISEKETKQLFQFLPLGTTVEPEKGKIALDVGNKCIPGVIDHHTSEGEEDCTTSMIWKKPELVIKHVGDMNPDEVIWILHEQPDFDCISSFYLAWMRLKLGFFPPGSEQLQNYAYKIDAGADFLENLPFPERTPYSLFIFYLNDPLADVDLKAYYNKRMKLGFQVMTYLCEQEILGNHCLINNIIPQDHHFLKANQEIGRDIKLYEKYDEKMGKIISVKIQINGRKKEVKGIVLDSPRAHFFKAWVRNAGYQVLVVRWLPIDKPDPRIVISVPPAIQFGLKGLGKALEKAEEKKRAKIGKKRKGPKRWEDVSNNDPWYDGRSPAHAYTIVDSPRMGTVLTVEEVIKILQQKNWQK